MQLVFLTLRNKITNLVALFRGSETKRFKDRKGRRKGWLRSGKLLEGKV